MSQQTLYTAEAAATGGRNGHIRSTDGVLNLEVSAPRALGGRPGATNPEQLFAAGYASCFQQVMIVTAGREKMTLPDDFTVNCEVTLFQIGEAYGLAATLNVTLAGLARDQAETLVRRAHEICPYSVGTRGNMAVTLNLVDAKGHKTELTALAHQ